jgi:hypothetical protein
MYNLNCCYLIDSVNARMIEYMQCIYTYKSYDALALE